VKKIIEEHGVDEKKLEKLDKETGVCRQKEQFWNSPIECLNSVNRSSTYNIEVMVEWCEEKKKKPPEEGKKVNKERAKRRM